MPKTILIHGFNVSDEGKGTTSKLAPYLNNEEFEVEIFLYGWLGLMGVYFINPRVVKQLLDKVSPGDVGVGHSNGCLILHMAAHYGAPFSKVIYINPALKSNVSFATQIDKVFVIHTDGDMAVKFASWLRALIPWAPLGDPMWGDMGARGHQTKKYQESEYNPIGVINKLIYRINILCIKAPILLHTLRLFFVPVGLFYWFILGPVEFLITYFRNNIIGSNADYALNFSRIEDLRFTLFSFVIPIITWSVGVIAYNII
ncbi:hypothetical protein [Pseudoalteromonas nigrifaciens]|uniref:hypothetical protein n=1 Tax=Pseudoalteromonas nigrifaciens TaxID=28109 RepID=UPI00178835C6|nr:hypothetical protein [Pseudoalteromonas nigrifaciens]MBE0421987.1 hypothetical protein [Pseudoalteromonas nigrifaciens]